MARCIAANLWDGTPGAMNFRDVEYRRQENFRSESATISADGGAPTDPRGIAYPHLLALGHEDENLFPSLRGDEGARKFFGERGIRWWRHAGFDQAGESGPTRNMASSQIACVNFLLPLAGIEDALLALLRAIDEDVIEIAAIEDPAAGTSSTVEFEWIGLGHALEGRGHTIRGEFTTSVDAFILAETPAGRRAYLFEWKYIESYGENDKGVGKQGRTRQRRYMNPYASSPAFRRSLPLDAWLHEPFYQIMRQRLLADRMVAKRELGVSEAKVVLVVPDENIAYHKTITSPTLRREFPGTTTVAEVIRATMHDPRRNFSLASQRLLADAARPLCGPDWCRYQRERYGW